jgi:N-acetylglucosaminyl-diphospho-decaprenol L-rhamnosyltransferase
VSDSGGSRGEAGGARLPCLSVVIVLYNSADELGGCLDSIRAAVASGWAEVTLVDNGSPDESVTVARRELPQGRVITLAENRGFAAGVNAALPECSAPHVLVLNPDVQVPEGGLQELVAWMDAHPELVAASPELVGSDGVWGTPGRALPTIWRLALRTSRLHRLMPRRVAGELLRGAFWPGGDQLGVDWVPATALVVRANAVAAAGPLREDLFLYGEDVEWCERLRRSSGGRIGVCAELRFVHRASASITRTWGEAERDWMIDSGMDRACRIIYGEGHARRLAWATALSLAVDARAPWRPAEERSVSQAAARRWLRIARSYGSARSHSAARSRT